MSSTLSKISTMLESEGTSRKATALRFQALASLLRSDRTISLSDFTPSNTAQRRLLLAGFILANYDVVIPPKSKLSQAQVLFGWADLGHEKVFAKVVQAINAGADITQVENVYTKVSLAKDKALAKAKESPDYKVSSTTTLLKGMAERLEKADFAKSAEADAEIARIEQAIAKYKAIKMVSPVVVTESAPAKELITA